jgi:hypothetical protein
MKRKRGQEEEKKGSALEKGKLLFEKRDQNSLFKG